MATPRVGALGVATTKGDLYSVLANGDLERLAVGTDGQVLVADSTTATGLKWITASIAARASLFFDAVEAIYKLITVAGGPTALPTALVRNTSAVLSYLNGVIQGIVWQSAVPQIYDGGALTLSIYWVASTAAAGNVVWAAAFERNNVTFDIDADGFSALQTGAATATPASAGQIVVTTIAFTNVQAASIAAGDPFRLLVQRTGTAVGDTYAASAEIVRVTLTEN